jgi:hypothetical protein
MDRRSGTSCQRRAIFFSSLQGRTHHTPPSPAIGQYHHQSDQLLRSGRILANQAKAIDRPAVDWNLVVLKSALRQSQYKILRHLLARRDDQFNSYFGSAGRCDARHYILNGAVRNSALSRSGRGGPNRTQTGPGPPKAPPWRREKQPPPPATPAVDPRDSQEPAGKSPPTFSNP